MCGAGTNYNANEILIPLVKKFFKDRAVTKITSTCLGPFGRIMPKRHKAICFHSVIWSHMELRQVQLKEIYVSFMSTFLR
jgi:hypothetical protein